MPASQPSVRPPRTSLAKSGLAGFDVQPRRIITETISDGTPAEQRPAFRKLLDRLDPNDVLVVTKLDRLRRNAMGVRSTVDRPEA